MEYNTQIAIIATLIYILYNLILIMFKMIKTLINALWYFFC